MGIDKVGIDKVGIDKVGIDKVGRYLVSSQTILGMGLPLHYEFYSRSFSFSLGMSMCKYSTPTKLYSPMQPIIRDRRQLVSYAYRSRNVIDANWRHGYG